MLPPVLAVLEEFSAPGDLVLDPFAGYGTTLLIAARLGRRGVGVELSADRLRIARVRLGPEAAVHHGDARRLTDMVSGSVDLCLTSPPYMNAVDHPQNPLTAYATLDADYRSYLDELAEVFAQVAGRLRPGGHLVVNVATIRTEGVVTPLARDVGDRIRPLLHFRQETLLQWDRPPAWLSSDHCLVFQRTAQRADGARAAYDEGVPPT